MERCTLNEHGFVGLYFPGTHSHEKAVIAAGGASCDEKTSVSMCRYLRKAGYNVLVLGFYLWEGLPKDLVAIPVDYVENAVKWLKTEKGIRGIAMTAASTGAGYTLLAASLIPEIGCVIPVVPYDYVPAGTIQRGLAFQEAHRSQYTWHGKDLPYTPIEILDKRECCGG
jgi:BAAT / Acyl-CoA thioester hydrolase C terminal.